MSGTFSKFFGRNHWFLPLNYLPPAAHLQPFLRLYRIIDFCFGVADVIPVKWYAPRPEVCLHFDPHNREQVQQTAEGIAVTNNGVALIGQHTTIFLPRNVPHTWLQLNSKGQLVYCLQPAGFFENFLIGMNALTAPPTLE